MYKLIVKERDGRLGILELRDSVIYCGDIVKDSRKGDEINPKEVEEYNRGLLPWYKRIFK